MKRELFIHYSFWFAFFVFVALVKRYFVLSDWGFWIGGIFGTILPDIDHIIYFYFVSPIDLTSQRFDFMVQKKQFGRMAQLLYDTRTERKGLIFHTFFFQIIFYILTFWMMSSSGSLFGKGMVLAFALHLSIDQLMDLTEIGNLGNWKKYLPFNMNEDQERLYWFSSSLLVLIFGFLF